MPVPAYIPALSYFVWTIGFDQVWVRFTDAPPPWVATLLITKPYTEASLDRVSALFTPSIAAPVDRGVGQLQALVQHRALAPTPTIAQVLPSTPAADVAMAGSGPGALLFCLLGALLFLWSILMFVGRIDKTQGRDSAARYRAFANVFFVVLCTVATALVACLDLCLDALVTLVVFVIGLWAQFCRILRLALGLLLSLLWSVLVFDIVCFLVSCNVVGGIVIDLARTVIPVVWVFVTHVV